MSDDPFASDLRPRFHISAKRLHRFFSRLACIVDRVVVTLDARSPTWTPYDNDVGVGTMHAMAVDAAHVVHMSIEVPANSLPTTMLECGFMPLVKDDGSAADFVVDLDDILTTDLERRVRDDDAYPTEDISHVEVRLHAGHLSLTTSVLKWEDERVASQVTDSTEAMVRPVRGEDGTKTLTGVMDALTARVDVSRDRLLRFVRGMEGLGDVVCIDYHSDAVIFHSDYDESEAGEPLVSTMSMTISGAAWEPVGMMEKDDTQRVMLSRTYLATLLEAMESDVTDVVGIALHPNQSPYPVALHVEDDVPMTVVMAPRVEASR